MPDETRYILVEDDDSHFYVIPLDKEREFKRWVASQCEDTPSWAQRTYGAPSLVSFTDPQWRAALSRTRWR